MGTLEKGACYNISMVNVKVYNGVKYFSTISSTVITVIDDRFAELTVEKSSSSFDEKARFVADVVGIESFSQFLGCLSCKSKVSELNKTVGKCTKCGIMVKLAKCKKNVAA